MSHWSVKYQENCLDGGKHDGILELMTWDGVDECGNQLSWAAIRKEQANELKMIFLEEYNSNEEAFFEYWPQGFRWTCCGLTGDMECGCDHHGTGSMACQCDFCLSGMSVPDKIMRNRSESQAAEGLTLASGPDVRSFDSDTRMEEDF